MPAEQGTEKLSVVYDHRGPRPVNAVIENGRSVTELMGFLVSCFSCGTEREKVTHLGAI